MFNAVEIGSAPVALRSESARPRADDQRRPGRDAPRSWRALRAFRGDGVAARGVTSLKIKSCLAIQCFTVRNDSRLGARRLSRPFSRERRMPGAMSRKARNTSRGPLRRRAAGAARTGARARSAGRQAIKYHRAARMPSGLAHRLDGMPCGRRERRALGGARISTCINRESAWTTR